VTPPAQLWTSCRLRCWDGTGTYVRLTAAAFAGLQCECAAAARPAAAGRLSGMKIEPKNAQLFTHRLRRNSPQLRRHYAGITQALRRHYAVIMQALRNLYAVITQALRSHYAVITQALRSHYADITQSLRRHYAGITQSLRNSITQYYAIHYAIHYAIPLRKSITQLNYANKLRRNPIFYTTA